MWGPQPTKGCIVDACQAMKGAWKCYFRGRWNRSRTPGAEIRVKLFLCRVQPLVEHKGWHCQSWLYISSKHSRSNSLFTGGVFHSVSLQYEHSGHRHICICMCRFICVTVFVCVFGSKMMLWLIFGLLMPDAIPCHDAQCLMMDPISLCALSYWPPQWRLLRTEFASPVSFVPEKSIHPSCSTYHFLGLVKDQTLGHFHPQLKKLFCFSIFTVCKTITEQQQSNKIVQQLTVNI